MRRLEPMRSSLAIKIFSAIALTLISLAVPVEAAAPTGEVEISQLLGELQTASPSTQPYDRALFVHWIDADGDGCDTRQEVLIEESLTPVVKGSGCAVVSGKWYSWYDGATWTNPTDVDIDHFVPLSEAWKSGAASWTPDRRRAFANDLGLDTGLEAVTDNVNQSKSDQDPSTWVPPLANVECRYVTDWVLMKYRWDLTVDTTEFAALNEKISGTCASTIVTVPSKG